MYDHNLLYCKSTNFGVLLYLANLANCVSSLIFVAANIYVDRTLHRRAAGETPNLIVAKLPPNDFILRNAKFYSRQNLLIYSISTCKSPDQTSDHTEIDCMFTSVFLRGLCGYIWVNILTLSPLMGMNK